jgi:hypothetical protein
MQAAAHCTDTLVRDLAREIEVLERKIAYPASDQTMNRRVEALFAATASLAQAPAATTGDRGRKLDVLCQRLREFLDPDDRGDVLTALLAESIGDDLRKYQDDRIQ